MFEDQFAEFLEAGIKNGQRQLGGIVKGMVKSLAPNVFDLLDVDNQDVFLEPLLFAYLNENAHSAARNSQYPIEQILFGYITEERRPQHISVLSDNDGIVYVPLVGYFTTSFPNREFKLSWRGSS
jgi:hypothetical protein